MTDIVKSSLLKTRVFDHTTGKMIYYTGIFNNKPFTQTSTFPQYESIPRYHNLSEVMLCTGLLDKENKPVYEKDILHWYVVNKKTGKMVRNDFLEVFINHRCPGFYVNLNGYYERLYESRMKYFTKMGNVYEHPDLLVNYTHLK